MFLIDDHFVIPVEQAIETITLAGSKLAIVGHAGEFIPYPGQIIHGACRPPALSAHRKLYPCRYASAGLRSFP